MWYFRSTLQVFTRIHWQFREVGKKNKALVVRVLFNWCEMLLRRKQLMYTYNHACVN